MPRRQRRGGTQARCRSGRRRHTRRRPVSTASRSSHGSSRRIWRSCQLTAVGWGAGCIAPTICCLVAAGCITMFALALCSPPNQPAMHPHQPACHAPPPTSLPCTPTNQPAMHPHQPACHAPPTNQPAMHPHQPACHAPPPTCLAPQVSTSARPPPPLESDPMRPRARALRRRQLRQGRTPAVPTAAAEQRQHAQLRRRRRRRWRRWPAVHARQLC